MGRISANRLAGVAVACALTGVLGLTGCGDDDGDTATVAFTTPEDGAAVAGGLTVAMTADGITIEEAGEANDGAGHFHVIADDGCSAVGAAIARDADHVHFGKGQSDGTIYLDPGDHQLCLQAGDGTHRALDATDTVEVNVGITDLDQWCAVVGEVDELFARYDAGGEDFAALQVGYTNIGRLLNQLDAGSDVVDPEARDDVRASLALAANLASSVSTAADEADAIASSEALWEGRQGDQTMPGADWIAATCGVDVDG